LTQVLRLLPKVDDPNILVGTNTADDAAVYRISDDLAIVQTVDYFTPVVDDPFTFGMITAANSLSDIYAMGAKPLFALNIVGFPSKQLPLEVLAEILKGGATKAAEAGISIIGGHTIEDSEPKYGLVVTAVIEPQKVVTNAKAKPGDVLVLTKPLGIGIITTAIKRGVVAKETINKVVEVMSTLNKSGAEVMVEVGVNACTDITGFGFLGHLHEMVKGSGVGAKISLGKVPVLSEAWELIAQGIAPGGTYKNLEYLQNDIIWDNSISVEAQLILADAQTSGGLLIAVPSEKAHPLVTALEQAQVPVVAIVGEIVADPACRIQVIP
jgi:selenide,water dikinase